MQHDLPLSDLEIEDIFVRVAQEGHGLISLQVSARKSIVGKVVAALRARSVAAMVLGNVRYDVLYEYAKAKRLDYNELCHAFRAALLVPVEPLGDQRITGKMPPKYGGIQTRFWKENGR